MEERDFEWCFEHENLFRQWLDYIYYHIDYYDMDNDSILSLWQEAKKYALEIANSRNPELSYSNMFREIFYNTHDHKFYLFFFIHTMLMSIKNENLETFANLGNKTFRDYLNKKKIDENSIDEFAKDTAVQTLFLACGQLKSDYDYSLPDGGIKDETITQTITKTDAGTAENNETLLEELTPIFYGNKEQAEDYIQKIKNITKDVEKIRYTAQLVNENTISEMSCHRDLYSILHDHRLYNKSESNWNKVISQYLVKK